MRKATKNVAINRDQKGQLIGISLGYEYVHEHEHGIRDILKAFGVPNRITEDTCGFQSHQVTRVPKDLSFYPNVDGFSYLMFTDFFADVPKKSMPNKDTLDRYMCYRMTGLDVKDNEMLVASWENHEFAIRVKLKERKPNPLEEIYTALKARNALIYLSKKQRQNKNSSLNISIVSRLNKESLMEMKRSDQNLLALFDEAAVLIPDANE